MRKSPLLRFQKVFAKIINDREAGENITKLRTHSKRKGFEKIDFSKVIFSDESRLTLDEPDELAK